MKTTVLAIVLTAAFHLCNAQVNPQLGYVLTWEGDTVRGVIDYRTDSHNASACNFRKEGETSFREYGPKDIASYRINDNGAYYVSLELPIEGKKRRVFAQYLLEGGVSLYYVRQMGFSYYYIVGEDGEVAEIRGYDEAEFTGRDAVVLRRNNLAAASHVLSKDITLVHQLWKSDVNARNLTKLVRQYNEKYCTDAGECIEYQYDEHKTASFLNKWFLEAGGGFGDIKYKGDGTHAPSTSKLHLSGPVFYLGISNNISFIRSLKNIDIQTLFRIVLFNVKKEDKTLLSFYPEIQIGPVFKLNSSSKFTPYFCAGVNLKLLAGFSHEEGLDSYEYVKHGIMDGLLGYYGGFGVDIHAGKRIYRINANINSFTLLSGSFYGTVGFGFAL